MWSMSNKNWKSFRKKRNCQSIYDHKGQSSFHFRVNSQDLVWNKHWIREITFGTPGYTFSPLGWLMITPGLGFRMLWAMSSYMNTTMFSSFTPPFRSIWYAWHTSAYQASSVPLYHK
jgi:hypothetical protein